MSKPHVYVPLAETSLGSKDLYDIYGIVIDAQAPHQKKGKFMQFIKIIDQTLCPRTEDNGGMFNKGMPHQKELNNGCVKVTFFSKTLEALPNIKKVGDIIRIHRANIGIYRN